MNTLIRNVGIIYLKKLKFYKNKFLIKIIFDYKIMKDNLKMKMQFNQYKSILNIMKMNI